MTTTTPLTGEVVRRIDRIVLLAAILPVLSYSCFGQEFLQLRWQSHNTSPPISWAGGSPQLLKAVRTGLTVMPEETIISSALAESPLFGLPEKDSQELQSLFYPYYKRLRQSEPFKSAPSSLAYCLSDIKPTNGLVTVYVPAKWDRNTRSIIFLHGYDGSLLAYAYFLSGVFPNRIIICPAYGITCGNIPWKYIKESEDAVGSRLKIQIDRPLLIGLSAGGFGACRIY